MITAEAGNSVYNVYLIKKTNIFLKKLAFTPQTLQQ